jgi:cell division protein FtsW (lipid II flippase)
MPDQAANLGTAMVFGTIVAIFLIVLPGSVRWPLVALLVVGVGLWEFRRRRRAQVPDRPRAGRAAKHR